MFRYIGLILIISFLFPVNDSFGENEEILTWEDCVKEGAKNHPDLISAEEGVKEAQASKNFAVSPLFPEISADLNASFSKASGGNNYSYGVNGSQVLFDGLKNINNIKAASANVKAARYSYNFTSSDVRLRLRSAFINLLKSQELLLITQEIQKIRKDNYDLITLRYKSGTEHKGALLTAEANLAQAEYEIAQAERGRDVSQRELVKEMGRTRFSTIRATGEFKVSDPVREKPDFEALVKSNPSYEKIQAQKMAASFGVKYSYGNFMPNLFAQGGFNRTGGDWPPNSNVWSAGLSLSLPLFQGGLRIAELSRAKAVYRQFQANERSIRDGVIFTLEQRWADLQDAVASVKVQNKYLIAAEERAKIAKEQYSLGLLSFDNWTIIEDALVKAKRNYLDSRSNSLLAEANWVQAKGETLDHANN